MKRGKKDDHFRNIIARLERELEEAKKAPPEILPHVMILWKNRGEATYQGILFDHRQLDAAQTKCKDLIRAGWHEVRLLQGKQLAGWGPRDETIPDLQDVHPRHSEDT